MPNGIGIG
ncbi:unnamed protein product, partial [Rotaria sp. Silwood2]